MMLLHLHKLRYARYLARESLRFSSNLDRMGEMLIDNLKLCWMWFKSNERGVTSVEYAIMLVIVAVALLVSAPGIGTALVGFFSKIASLLTTQAGKIT